jgi:hypothetical protein
MNINSAINTQKPRKISIYRKAKWDSMKEDVSNLHRKLQQEGTNGADINKLTPLLSLFLCFLYVQNLFGRECTSSLFSGVAMSHPEHYLQRLNKS